MGSPFTARLLVLLAEELTPEAPLGPRLLAWDGSPDEAVPLRLAGAFHALVLSGEAPRLAAAYPPQEVSDAALRAALADTLRDHAAAVGTFLDSPPQTNEVGRSAILIAATQAACTAALVRAGARATPDAPLAHLAMERDGRSFGAAVSLTLWPRGETFPFGRTDFHGRWVDWRAWDPGAT